MKKKEYYPQLDSLRAIAALGVINHHWLNSGYLSSYGINESYDWGYGQFGVQLFFVLSGFLIAEILIKNKGKVNNYSIITNFFIRRVLRLFPIYYLFILFLVLLKDKFVIDNILWFLTYTANIKFYLVGGFVDIWSNHVWTLSIEEQFYLVFPAIILFIPRKNEYYIPIAFILLAVLFKTFGGLYFEGNIHILIIAQIDMLGVGVLLALIKYRNPSIFSCLITSKAKLVSILLFVGSIFLYYLVNEYHYGVLFQILLMICYGLLVANTASGFEGIIGKCFQNRILQYLGKISYGLYLYHKIVPLTLLIFLNKTNLSINNVYIYYLVNIFILLVVSHFSWVIIESRILRLKDRFEYISSTGLAKRNN